VAHENGALSVPGEAVTDPVAYTLALVAAAEAHGAELRTASPVTALRPDGDGLTLETAGGERLRCRMAVNCAGLRADEVAQLAGEDGWVIYPRKGEFLVFDVEPPEQILLPVPSEGTKGVLVFPTLDGKVVAGPTAVDGEDKDDWSVRAEAREAILPKAIAMYPPLRGAEPLFAYAGLRPAGRGFNYAIGISPANDRLVNVSAIRSTGLTASLGIADHVVGLIAPRLELGEEEPLRAGTRPADGGPWWRRTADRKTAA
jgi:glycerol-3-phosphate dehydrogenase